MDRTSLHKITFSLAIAETIVELGIDVGSVMTTGSLMQALVLAFERVGVRVKVAK